MNKSFINKTLVFGIIILLAGLAFTPTITGDFEYFQNTPPIADFTYEPAQIFTNQIVYLNSTSYDPDGTIVNWTWNFGDGIYAYTEQTTHTYPNNGVYTVNLTVTDNESDIGSIEKVVIVNNQDPVAVFSYEPAVVTTYETVYFNSTSYDPDGTIVNWTWNFGDGSYAYTEQTTHQYIDSGTYIVNLTVTDDDAVIASTEQTITVGNQPPIADFIFSPEIPEANETVNFTDLTIDPDGNIVTWWWSFGDGYFATQQNPTHEYEMYGEFTINLTVTDDDGATDSFEKPITVLEENDPPYPPSNPYPPHNSNNNNIDIELMWDCSDPDGDELTYDIYFGNVTPPVKVVSNYTGTTWDPGLLELETTYFWQIVAWDDNDASTAGPLWNFTTTGPPNDPPYGPVLTGPGLVQTGKEYTFMLNTLDPDKDDVRFIITWGDSTTTTTQFGPHNEPQIVNHTWAGLSPLMILRITTTAEDTHGAKSITIEQWIIVVKAKTHQVNPNGENQRPIITFFLEFISRLINRFPIFGLILEHNPNAFPILQRLLNL